MKALIIYPTNELEPAHSTAVQSAFVAGGGVNSDLYNITTFDQIVVDYATTNNYDAIVYSYSGEDGYFTLANSNPDIMIFMPSDSYNGDLQQLVLCDDLPSTDDYEFAIDTDTQSDSNGYICGQLFYIASQRGCSLQEARICANATKDSDGIIDVVSAINHQEEIKLTVGEITAERTSGFPVSVTLGRVIDSTNYKIYRKEQDGTEWTLISTQTTLTYSDTLPDYGVYSYKYYAYNDNLSSDYSSEVTIKYGALPIYEITSDTYSNTSYSQGFLIITNPIMVYENDNLIFGKKYKLDYTANVLGIRFYHSGSGLEFTEIENGAVFTARGKLILIELPKNETIEFNQFNLVEA